MDAGLQLNLGHAWRPGGFSEMTDDLRNYRSLGAETVKQVLQKGRLYKGSSSLQPS